MMREKACAAAEERAFYHHQRAIAHDQAHKMQAPVWVVTQFPQFPVEPLLTISFEEWYTAHSNDATAGVPDRKFLVFHKFTVVRNLYLG